METAKIIYEVTGTESSWNRGGTVRFKYENIKSVWIARQIAHESWTATIWTIDPVTGKRVRFENQKQAKIAYAEFLKTNKAV